MYVDYVYYYYLKCILMCQSAITLICQIYGKICFYQILTVFNKRYAVDH